jgi:hypothetical protein
VDDNNKCGARLFRFPATDMKAEVLMGQTRWGDMTKSIQIDWNGDVRYDDGASGPGDPHVLEIFLGDGHDFGGRSDNIPKFHAPYRRLGAARCVAR